MMSFLWWGLVGLLTGWQIGKNMKGFGYGPILDWAMGIGGGLLGGFIVSTLSLSGVTAVILTTLGATLGAAAATGFVGFASGERRHADAA